MAPWVLSGQRIRAIRRRGAAPILGADKPCTLGSGRRGRGNTVFDHVEGSQRPRVHKEGTWTRPTACPATRTVSHKMFLRVTFVTLHGLSIATLGVPAPSEAFTCCKASALTSAATAAGAPLKERVCFCIRLDEGRRMSTAFTLTTLSFGIATHSPHWFLSVPAPAALCLTVLPVNVCVCLIRCHANYIRKINLLSTIIAGGIRVSTTALACSAVARRRDAAPPGSSSTSAWGSRRS